MVFSFYNIYNTVLFRSQQNKEEIFLSCCILFNPLCTNYPIFYALNSLMDRRAVNRNYICNMLQSDTMWCVLAFIVNHNQALLTKECLHTEWNSCGIMWATIPAFIWRERGGDDRERESSQDNWSLQATVWSWDSRDAKHYEPHYWPWCLGTVRTLPCLPMINVCTLTGHIPGHCEIMLLGTHFFSGLLWLGWWLMLIRSVPCRPILLVHPILCAFWQWLWRKDLAPATDIVTS